MFPFFSQVVGCALKQWSMEHLSPLAFVTVTQNYIGCLKPAQIWMLPHTGKWALKTPEPRRQTQAVQQKQWGHRISIWEREQGQQQLSPLNEQWLQGAVNEHRAPGQDSPLPWSASGRAGSQLIPPPCHERRSQPLLHIMRRSSKPPTSSHLFQMPNPFQCIYLGHPAYHAALTRFTIPDSNLF